MGISDKRQAGCPNLRHRTRHCHVLYSSNDFLGNIPASFAAIKEINISSHAQASRQTIITSIAHVCFDRTVPRDLLAAKSVLLPFVKV